MTPPQRHTGPLVLVIEDDPDTREIVQDALSELGYRSRTAGSGADALRLFDENVFDMVLCDLLLPDADGKEIISRIARRSPDTPLIVFSGQHRLEEAVESLRCGAWDYVSKSVDYLEALSEVLSRCHARARAIREAAIMRDRLQETERLFEAMFETSPIMMLRMDEAARIESVNSIWRTQLGWKASDIAGRLLGEFIADGSPTSAAQLLETVATDRLVMNREVDLRAADDSSVHVALNCALTTRPQGERSIVCTMQDISTLKRTKRELVKIANQFRSIYEEAAEGIVLCRSNGDLVDANPSALTMFGYSRSELQGMSWYDLTPPSEHEDIARRLEMIAAGSDVRRERFIIRKDGGSFPAWVSSRRIDENLIEIIVRDLSGRKALEEQLARARDKAEAVSLAKSEFLAILSREVRTPLNTIRGMTELALTTRLTEEQHEYLSTARDSVARLLTELDGVKSYARLEARGLGAVNDDFELRRLLADILDARSSRAMAMRIGLELDVDSAVPDVVRGDMGKLRHVLGNLLDCALQNIDQGRIRLKAHMLEAKEHTSAEEPPHILFIVEDTGIGIPSEVQEEFFKLPDSDAPHEPGLAMAVSRELASAMNGRLWLESEQGEGTTFFLDIPLEPGDETQVRRPWEAPRWMAQPRTDSLRVLVVDDSPMSIRVVERFLDKMGHAAVAAGNGSEALEVLGRQPFDLVFMDISMPVLDGLETTRRIRSGETGPKNAAIPIIAMTVLDSAEHRDRCLAAGMNDYVNKPLDFNELTAILFRVAESALPGGDEGQAASLILDREDALYRLGDDTDFLRELYDFFLAELPESVSRLRSLVAAADMSSLVIEAHTLKSTCGTIGATAARNAAEHLEQAARAQDVGATEVRLDELERELERVRSVLENWESERPENVR